MTARELEAWLVAKVAAAMKVSVGEVDCRKSFAGQGLDSLAILNLTGELAEFLGRDLSTSLLWEFPLIADLVGHLAASPDEGSDGFIPRASRDRPLPLSFSQERIWRHARRDAEGDTNLIVHRFILRGGLNTGALRRSFTELIRRHEILRTSIGMADGQPVQMIQPLSDSVLVVTDLSAEPDPDREALRLFRALAMQPMQLERGPLVRMMLLRLAESEHRLAIVLHHILYDASSIRVLFAELRALYAAFCEGTSVALTEVPLQQADFAAWQRHWLRRDGEVYQGKLAWWRRYWSEPMPRAIDFTFLRVRQVPQEEAGPLIWDVPPVLVGQIRALGRSAGATTHMVLFAAFEALLHQVTGLPEFVVGTYVSDRIRLAAKDSIGAFVSLVALRARPGVRPRFVDLLREVRETLQDATIHQGLPFEELVRELQAEGRQVPPVQVIFQHVQGPAVGLNLPGLAIQRWTDGLPSSNCWGLTLTVREDASELTVHFGCDTAMYDASRVAGMLRQYEALLEAVCADPDQPILPLVPVDSSGAAKTNIF